MSLGLEKADAFCEDFAFQVLWYVREAGEDVAGRSLRRLMKGSVLNGA